VNNNEKGGDMENKSGTNEPATGERPPIYIVGGSKGGVGKTMVAMALLDHLERASKAEGTRPLLVETDTSNPDVWKAYQDEVKAVTLNLDVAEGWIELVNVCEREPARTVVVNTAARNNEGVATHGDILQSSLGELGRELVTWWVINEQRDSLELLLEYMERIKGKVFVVKNLHFGRRFELYDGSTKVRVEVERRGGRDVAFPALAGRVAHTLYSRRLTVEKAARELALGERAEMNRWRGAFREAFAPLLAPQVAA